MPRHWWLALILAAGGCGGESFPLAAVSGTVTLDGAPVAGARVGFEPLRQGDTLHAGPGAYGETDQQGHYQLATLHGDEGAVIGPHVVWVSTLNEQEYPDGRLEVLAKEQIPERYRVNSILRFTVPADGTDQADFKLTSK